MTTKRNRPSYKKAVYDFCKSCIYDPGAEGSWLRQVTDCTALDCPLYSVRPTTKVKGESKSNE